MIYSDIAIIAFSVAVMVDLFVFKTSMLTRPAFWTSYAIILPFQFLTNWWLTSRNIVMYDPNAIIGVRFFSAPAEDVLFGFLVDAVREVSTITDSQVEPADSVDANVDKKYLLGVAKATDGRLIVLLDLVALFEIGGDGDEDKKEKM